MPSKSSQPPGASTPDNALDTRNAVAAKGKRKRRKRTAQACALRRINAKARDRQIAWAERNPTTVEELTGELEREYRALRSKRAKRADDVGAPFLGRSASYVSPPMPPMRSKWRGER